MQTPMTRTMPLSPPAVPMRGIPVALPVAQQPASIPARKPLQPQFGSVLLLIGAAVAGGVYMGARQVDKYYQERDRQKQLEAAKPPATEPPAAKPAPTISPEDLQTLQQFRRDYDALPPDDTQARLNKLKEAKVSALDQLRLYSLTSLEPLPYSNDYKRLWAQDMLNDRSEAVREKAKDLLIHLPVDRPNL